MNETRYRNGLKQRIRALFPGCVIMKNDPMDLQGVPDILVLYKNMWAMLEIKIEENAKKQPNQDHYIVKFDQMSFAAFINPDNEEEVLNALQSTFGLSRETCIP